MKTILALVMMLASFPLYGSENHPLMDRRMRLALREASALESLEFMRTKGTEFLHEVIPGVSGVVLIFEYRFDPAKYRGPVTYEQTNVLYGVALKDVLHQLGLTFRIQSVDRIEISDEPGDLP